MCIIYGVIFCDNMVLLVFVFDIVGWMIRDLSILDVVV